MHPFTYARFQEEAVASIRQGISVFVSAPTGAGKTVIAEVAVEEALRRGGMAIYTAPIKALSNQKFRDFHRRYPERVGILTGDLTLNPEAKILIMTTEIYRNSLLEGRARFPNCRWVIFDEVHYLDDRERGTVWEEALLLTPRETEILALSATVPNGKQLAAWIERIHGRSVRVVEESRRPVPLKWIFQCQDEFFSDLGKLKTDGYRNEARWRQRPMRRPRFRGRGRFRWVQPGAELPALRPNRIDRLFREIRGAGHLPCLYFTFSRRRAEELAWEIASFNLLPSEGRKDLLSQFDELCRKYQITHESSASSMRQLVSQGIAFHHAGLLPTLKEVLEILFASRRLQVIVTTETFALGVNMPARSVVLDTLMKRLGPQRAVLRVRELYQMAGRAGRRGMDEMGFVYLRVNPLDIPFDQLEHLLHGKPEQVASRFGLTYATILNLVQARHENLLAFYQKTLHAFQSPAATQREVFSMIERRRMLLREWGYLSSPPVAGGGQLTPKGRFATSFYGYELLLSELFEAGVLDEIAPLDLGILLLAVVYEPRRGKPLPRIPHRLRGLMERAEEVALKIHREERRLRITPMTKPPSFHLWQAMERWLGGASFEKTVGASESEEGELIRYFRMTVQLCRTLQANPGATPEIRKKAQHLFHRINRDEVDAEAELRRSL
ncbi:MAG: DEAD/DEAH box helicase [Candidatus Omnitrophica bacterium]|nr:DEAD/DEAH box helicase [Candidatus Omnitrophota bacterium]